MEVLMHEASRAPDATYNPEVSAAPAGSIAVDQTANGLVQPVSMTKPKKQPVDILFEDLSYTVSLGFRKGEKRILHRINGRLPARELIAIMGPSGAGKSTLLDVLSGYRITGVEGTVLVNGRSRNLNVFRRSSAYITQDDRLQPLLTVIENMRIAADLKMKTSTSIYEKEATIEEILTKLGLYGHMHTRASRLSGGQKKRLSIALELVNNPLVMFLDEPTTGLDSSSCTQVVKLLQVLARQGRTIVCTIHQPSASLFQLFDQVYVLARGECLYQGAASQMVPYLDSVKLPCPVYHNPADYVIELACGEHGEDKIDTLVGAMQNGRSIQWFTNRDAILDAVALRAKHPLKESGFYEKVSSQETSQWNQLKVLLRRGYLKTKRDTTLTHLRLAVNIFTGIMLGTLFLHAGDEGARVLDNYNLLFSILMHHMMTTMMLTILTFPTEMSILQKEHFNRWYSLRSYYISVTLVDIPVSIVCCLLFTVIVYFMSAQPLEIERFSMFLAISLLVSFVAQSFGLMIGAVFNVVNGTFLGPTISVPMMMFAGFGVSLRDLPPYLKWGSYVSYLRYGLEGYVGAIYGLDRQTLACQTEQYCHYRYPKKFLMEVAMDPDQFWFDISALAVILLLTRLIALLLLRFKLISSR
ncbi:ATP-binding cassette sub-family G member 4 [Athalia rosae]|uniref:ATP-binding cassette sub-family G member 4 n=1 Tax=Athalia rosae TaxID=37344 RepID=UPI000626CEF3|nr:ATP-binding cassette sub-family G member 4 [Athalia rosae]